MTQKKKGKEKDDDINPAEPVGNVFFLLLLFCFVLFFLILLFLEYFQHFTVRT